MATLSKIETVKKWPLSTIAGFAVIVLYCTFTFISISLFPVPVNPVRNFLSQLGNANLNPDGAIFYCLAVILAGLAAIPFYVGLYQWVTRIKKNNLMKVALAVGVVNGISIIMIGIFSESVHFTLHVFWSFLIFITFVPILLIVNTILLGYPEHNKLISYYGLIVAVIDIILLAAVTIGGFEEGGIGSIMEWAAVFSYLIWVGLMAYNTR